MTELSFSGSSWLRRSPLAHPLESLPRHETIRILDYLCVRTSEAAAQFEVCG